MPFWPRQHLEMPITRMGNEVNAQRVKGDEDERAGAGDGGSGERNDGNTGSSFSPQCGVIFRRSCLLS